MLWMTALLALAEPDLPPPDVAAARAEDTQVDERVLRRTRTVRDVGVGCAVGGPIALLGGVVLIASRDSRATDVIGGTVATTGALCTVAGVPMVLGAGHHARAIAGSGTRAWPATLSWALFLAPPALWIGLGERSDARVLLPVVAGGYLPALIVGGLWSERQLRFAEGGPTVAVTPLMHRGEPIGIQLSGRF